MWDPERFFSDLQDLSSVELDELFNTAGFKKAVNKKRQSLGYSRKFNEFDQWFQIYFKKTDPNAMWVQLKLGDKLYIDKKLSLNSYITLIGDQRITFNNRADIQTILAEMASILKSLL